MREQWWRHQQLDDLRRQLDALQAALEARLDRAIATNGLMREFLHDANLMDDFLSWQAAHWREGGTQQRERAVRTSRERAVQQ